MTVEFQPPRNAVSTGYSTGPLVPSSAPARSREELLQQAWKLIERNLAGDQTVYSQDVDNALALIRVAGDDEKKIFHIGNQLVSYDPKTSKAEPVFTGPAGQEPPPRFEQDGIVYERDPKTNTWNPARGIPQGTRTQETPDERLTRELALAEAQGGNQIALANVQSANRLKEEGAKIQAELGAWRDRYARGEVMTKAEEMELQGKIDRFNNEVATHTKDLLAQEEAKRAKEKFEREEKPYKDAAEARANAAETRAAAAETRAGETLAETRRQNEFAQRKAAAEGQASALYRQAEAGQAALKMGTEAGTAPNMAILRMAFGPLRQAQLILQQMVAEGKIDASALPTPAAPTPMAVPAAPAPSLGPGTAAAPGPGVTSPTAPVPSVEGTLQDELDRFAAPRPGRLPVAV